MWENERVNERENERENTKAVLLDLQSDGAWVSL